MLKLASLPFGTQAKRVVASILAILILLSASIGSATFVSAVADDSNATVTQTVYNNYDVNTQEEVLDKIGDLSNSLLSGKIPYYYTTAWTNGSANTNFALLTDNTIGTFFNVNFYKPYSYEYKGNTYSGSASRMYYELESAHEITSVILVDASHQATAGQGSAGIGNNNLTLPSFKVYLSETAKEHQLFDIESLNTSYSVTANTITPGDSKAIVYKINFNQPVDARYIGFEFPESSCAKGSNPVVIYEVAAFGTEKAYTVTTTAGTTSDTYDTSKNLIYNKMSTTYPTAFAGFTDGLNAKVSVGGASSNWPLKFTYKLDDTYKIDKVRVTSDASNYGNGKLRLGEYSIYVSDNEADLYNNENLIATVVGETSNFGSNQTVIDTIEFLETYDTNGSYIGFAIKKASLNTSSYANALVYELEVEGTVQTASPYTVSTTAGTTSDTYDTSKNLIYNKMSTTYPTAFAGFTDGLNAKVSVGGSGSNWPLKFTYKLDDTYKIDKVRVTSDASNYGTGKLRLGEYSIYVSDNEADLYNNENLIATVVGETSNYGANQTVIDTIEFLETYDTTGEYIGFAIKTATLNTASYPSAYIYELEVEGTANSTPPPTPPAPPTPTVTPTEYGTLTTSKGTTSDAINSDDSIINGKTVTQSYASAFAHFTDGTNALIGKGSNGWPYKFTYKLDGIYEIEQVKVISGTGTQRIGEFEIYVSDSAEKLFDSANKKATVTGESVAWVDGGKGTTIDTVDFKDDYAEGMYFGIKLTKAYPGADMTVNQEAYISEVLVKGTFKGVPDLTVLSTTHNTADWNTDTTNLIYGITPQENDTVTKFTDGVKNCTPTGMTRISFPFLSSTTVEKVRVISQNGYISGKSTRLAAYDIYIADSFEDLYKPENKVASFSTDSTASNYITAIETFEFSDTYAKTGKYIGFDITKTSHGGEEGKIYINEIEVFGTSHGGGSDSGATVLGTRPVLENSNENFDYKTEAMTISGGRNYYDNITLYGQAHTNQAVTLDYKFSPSIIPVVWAKAICANETKGSVTGYYATIEGGTSVKLYKRTSDGKDVYIGPCGNGDYKDQDPSIIRTARLQIVTEKVGNTTKITVMTYKFGSGTNADKCYLMTKRTFYDSTEELQTPGYAGFAVKGAGKTADVVSFAYSSSDGTADNLSYVENPVTASSSGIAGQKVIIDPAKTYTLTSRVSLDNTLLAIYYLDANGKMERGFSSVGTISNVGGYRTATYEFCLNDIIKENGLTAPYADIHGYSSMAEVFVGFTTDRSKVLSYSNLSLIEKESGEEKLTNNQFKMGLLSWAEAIETGKWAFEVGGYGSKTTRNDRLVLKTNVNKSAYDAIFKMGANESTGINYSKYSDFMLHINGDGGEYGKVGQLLELEVGQTYIYEVDFGFDPRNSAEPIIFYHTAEDKKISFGTRAEPVSKLTRNGCRTTYEFTVPDGAYVNPETKKATVFVGVSTGESGAKCYFYNFDLYNKNDASKTNLLLNPDFKEGFKNWIVNHNYQWNFLSPVGIKIFTQPGTGVELLPYDASKFTLDDGTLVVPDIPDVDYSNYKGKFMIYVPETVSSTYGKLGQVLYFEKGVKYNFTMSFKYIRQNSTKPVVLYYKDDPYATNEYIISKGYTNAKGEADRVKYLTAIRDTFSFDLIMDDANCTQTVEFKVPSDAWKNSEGKSPMFVGISSGEKGTKCYFADFCIAKEGSKENMLLNADFKKGFYNWIITYGYLIDPIKEEGVFWTNDTIAQILPFDEKIFINDTNDALWNDGDWYSVFGENGAVNGALNGGSSLDKQTVIVPGKINVPATIALYGGIALVLAAGAVVAIILIKKKKQQA